jgi:GNAT superfamily N-acetyltransferase
VSRKLALMNQTVTFTELGAAEFRPSINRFIAVYKAAMNPPERMMTGRESILARHATNPGFRALTAVLAAGGSPVLAGFTYGFHGTPGQWWHDIVAAELAMSPPPGPGGWLADSFEVAELHVVPAYQGLGIGRELLLRLTSGRSEHTAVLSTADIDSRARRLYRSVGFTDLLTGFRFSGAEPPYAVMGAILPLRAVPAPVPGSPCSPRSPRPSSW